MYGFLLEGLSFRCAGFCIYIDSTFLYIDRAPLVGSRCSNTMVSGKLEDGLDISLTSLLETPVRRCYYSCISF
jgi:hypothetical protein